MPDISTTEVTDLHMDGALMNALGSLIGNQMTGLGDRSRDKFAATEIDIRFAPLTQPELEALYRKSKICEKVVDLLPHAATAKNWLEVAVGQGRKGIPAKALQYAEDLKFRPVVQEAAVQGRLYGDGFVILGLDDGRLPYEPVNEAAIRQLSWVYPIDRYRLIPEANSGRPGHPEYYSFHVSSDEALPAQRDQPRQMSGILHRSRVLRFPGKKLYGDMIRNNAGYHDSVLQTFWSSFAKYLTAIEYSTRMVQDYNVFLYKLKGLANLILQGKEDDILKRFRAILLSFSTLGGLAIDNDNEDAQFISRNYGGLDQLIDRLKEDTGAASGLPPNKLWGVSHKNGLGSTTGDESKYEWADCVDDWRGQVVDEPVTDFFRLLFLAKNGPTGGRLPDSWNLKYASALRLTLKEQADLRKTVSEADKTYVDEGVLLPEEVRESAFGGAEYTIERSLQPDLWAQKQAEKEQQQQQQTEPPPEQAPQLPEDGSEPDEQQRTDSQEGEQRRPFALTGGTNHTDADNPILSMIDRADKALRGLEDDAIERVNSALESAYKDLEAQILRSYSQETPSSLMGRERAVVLLAQVADLLTLLNTRNAGDIQQAFEDLLRGSDAQGVTLAQDLARAIANQHLQMTANVPLAAIRNQATEGMTRLRNHTDAFADKASTIITQGLIQGWGTDKVASLLRQELGIVQHRAETIARTESLSASNGAAIANYQANGLALATWQATADDRLCPYCAARNQKIYRLEDLVIPAHPRCRCFASPASETWLRLGLIDTKWAVDFRAKSLAELRSQGLEPNNGLTPFEKANGVAVPAPVWEPGQHLDSVDWDDYREDAGGIPCGKGWIKAGQKCTKGVVAHHAAANPNHASHHLFQAAMAAQSGNHTHTAANPAHPDHAGYLAAFQSHGGNPATIGGGGSGVSGGGGAAATPAKAAKKTTTKKAAASTPAASAQPATPTPKATTKKTSKKAAVAPATTQPSTNPVKLNDAGLQAAHADLEQRFGKKLVSDAESNVKKVLSDADVFIRVGSADTLEKILGGGFKTSAELNVTSHSIPNLADKNYQDARNRVEAKTLGYDEKNTQPGDRPIYGYLGGSDLNGQSHADVSRAYGSIAVKLKPEVKDRTSFTGADSFKSGIASAVNDPNAASLVSLTRHGYDRDQLPKHYPSFMRGDQNDKSLLQAAAKAKSVDDLAPKLSRTGNAYMEAQVHGGVKASDIAEIHFSPSGASDRPNAAIAQFAKDNGVALHVNGKKLSSKEIDDLITPSKDHALNKLNDALDKGDLQGIFDHVDTIAAHAASVKMAPGERDKYLKAMYQIAGYDNKPTIGTEADVTKAWQDGGVLMVRGDRPDPTDKTKYFRQFQSGDFHVGNGIYGNGTYVGHAGAIVNGKFVGHNPATAKADAKRAFDDVAKNGYISAKTVNTRMALTKDANVALQSDIEKQRKAASRKLDALHKAEQKKIQTAGAKFSPADTQKYNTALAQAQQANVTKFGAAKPKLSHKTSTNATNSLIHTELHHYELGSSSDHLKLAIKSEGGLFGAKTWHYADESGTWQKASTKTHALNEAKNIAIAERSKADALKATGLTSAPGSSGSDAASQLKKLADKVDAVKHVMGLNTHDTDGISYFAMLRGYDAVALDNSYEKNTFMTLLNRSKVVVQKDELNYNKAKKTGAL